jgi:hypothetical protein
VLFHVPYPGILPSKPSSFNSFLDSVGDGCRILNMLSDSAWSFLLIDILLDSLMSQQVLDILPDLIRLGGVGVLPHGEDAALEQVVHGFDAASLELGEAKIHIHDADVCDDGEDEEGSVANACEHLGRRFGDAVVEAFMCSSVTKTH